MTTQEAEKIDIVRMDVSVTPLLCPFPDRRGNPAVFVFFAPHQVNFIVDMLKRQEQFEAARAPRLAEQHQVPVNESAFSLPKEYMCLFKAHSLCLERVVFSFWGAGMFDHVNFQWFLIITCA